MGCFCLEIESLSDLAGNLHMEISGFHRYLKFPAFKLYQFMLQVNAILIIVHCSTWMKWWVEMQ